MNIYIMHIRAYIFIYLTTSLVTYLHAYLLHWYSYILSYVGQKMQLGMLKKTMLQRRVFINKNRILQRRRRNTTCRRSPRVCMTYRAFPLLLECQSSNLLWFVRFSYQFTSVICLFSPLAVKIYFFNFYIILEQINLDIKKEITLL